MSTDSPWTTVASREVYRNAWMWVREDDVIRPDGSRGIYGVVDKHDAVGVVALTDAGEVVLVGQYRYPTDVYSWEIVEGGVDDGEDPLGGGQRELEEEAGLVASSWLPLGGELHLSNSVTSERAFLYLATGLTETVARPDPTEVLTLRTVPMPEAVDMVVSGEIVDALSVMGILLAARLGFPSPDGES
jgi:8-oxo-dGTP pyrophosphatase MutT (NUDIX family)